MAEMIIMLRRDPDTGKQNILVKLNSDEDTLPLEHEQMHRSLVEKLIGAGLNPDDLGEVIVDREPQKEAPAPTGNAPPQERKKTAEGR
jgi:hypothetical protein